MRRIQQCTGPNAAPTAACCAFLAHAHALESLRSTAWRPCAFFQPHRSPLGHEIEFIPTAVSFRPSLESSAAPRWRNSAPLDRPYSQRCFIRDALSESASGEITSQRRCDANVSAVLDLCCEQSDARDSDEPVSILNLDLFINETTNSGNKFMQFKNSPTDGLWNKGKE